MDIKWKNRLQVIGLIFLFTFGLKGVLSGYNLLAYENDYLKGNYFHTQGFENELHEFIGYLSLFELSGVTMETAKQEITVSEHEIEEHRYRYGSLEDQIESISHQYEDQIQVALAKNKEVADLYMAERDKKIEDITNNFRDDDHVREKIILEKELRIDEHFKNLEHYRSRFLRYKEMFTYYLKDSETGNVYTNLNLTNDQGIEDVINEKNMMFIQTYPSSKYGYLVPNDFGYRIDYPEEIDFSQYEKPYTGQIAVSKSLPASNQIIAEANNFKKIQMLLLIYTLVSIFALAMSVYFYKKTRLIQSLPLEKWRPYYEWLALDIRLITFTLTGIFTFVFLTSGSYQYYFYNNIMYMIEDQLFLTIISAIFLFLTYVQGEFLIEKTKDLNSLKAEWKEGIVYSSYKSTCKMINDLFLVRSITVQVFVLLGIVSTAFLVVSFVALIDPYIIAPFILIAFVICLIVLLFILRRTAYLNRIITNVDEIVKGNIHSDIPVKGKSVLAVLAKNINSLKQGVVVSQKEQAKSERLKTELITNVSHDLRTPLTSIITYTELLKKTDVTSEDGKSYIEIIDRKSKRLKVLIDDLFEASKMASGNIELVKEKVDIVQLLHQALAEYNEVIEQSSLQLRVTSPDHRVNVVVDGQKMWRVFDNLIGNILKYSLENTRVYISITTIKDHAVITFKNVTKYELGENVDELFERFKRGDTSRQTDGSGLGLAIAKSIVDLHQGALDIDLDGDLFKVTVKLNL